VEEQRCLWYTGGVCRAVTGLVWECWQQWYYLAVISTW